MADRPRLERLLACSGCSRHVKANEAACPFCGASLANAVSGSTGQPYLRMAAAAVVAASVVAVSGCSSGDDSSSGVAFYGAPQVNDSGATSDAPAVSVGTFYGAAQFDASSINVPDAAVADAKSGADAEANEDATVPDGSAIAFYGAPAPPEDSGITDAHRDGPSVVAFYGAPGRPIGS